MNQLQHHITQIALLLITLGGLQSTAIAEQVLTAADMEAFLSDSLLIEDFEGVSVHGGSLVAVPNPLNSDTQFPTQGILPGISYLSNTETLYIYGGFVNGAEDVYLRGGSTLTITFDSPQAGVGMRVIGSSSQFNYSYIVTFKSDTETLGSLSYNFGRSFAFAGWRDTSSGITSVEITALAGSSIPSAIDNVMFGATVNPSCPADLNFDGEINTADLGILIADFGTNSAAGDINNDGAVDTADLGILIAEFGSNCP